MASASSCDPASACPFLPGRKTLPVPRAPCPARRGPELSPSLGLRLWCEARVWPPGSQPVRSWAVPGKGGFCRRGQPQTQLSGLPEMLLLLEEAPIIHDQFPFWFLRPVSGRVDGTASEPEGWAACKGCRARGKLALSLLCAVLGHPLTQAVWSAQGPAREDGDKPVHPGAALPGGAGLTGSPRVPGDRPRCFLFAPHPHKTPVGGSRLWSDRSSW